MFATLETKTVNAQDALMETLKKMFVLEYESTLNPVFRNFVKFEFGSFVNSRNELYKKLHSYVVKNFIYKDEQDEFLTSPKKMLLTKQGDCDDFAMFIKAALKVLGIEARFLIAGKNINEFTHVLVLTNDNVLLDGTNDKFNFLDNAYKYTAIIDELN